MLTRQTKMGSVLSASFSPTHDTPTLTHPFPTLPLPINHIHPIAKHKSTAINQHHISTPTSPAHNRKASALSLTNPIAPTAPTNAHGTTNPLPRKKHHLSPHTKDTNTAPSHQIPLPFRTTRPLSILILNTLNHSSGNHTNLHPLPTTHQSTFRQPHQQLHHHPRPNEPTH